MPKFVNVEDYRILAQRHLPEVIFDCLEGSADDEIGMKHNRVVFERSIVAAPPHRRQLVRYQHRTVWAASNSALHDRAHITKPARALL